MKKLLFILFTLTIFASCKQPTIIKSDLPIEIVKLKELKQFDTTYTINNDKKVFIFNNKKEYLGAYKVENEEGVLFWLGLLVGLLIPLVIIAIVLDK